MPEAGRTVSADRLCPGDHAFLGYAGDAERWEVLGAFAREGFARGEKVILLVDADDEPGAVAARVGGGTAAARRLRRDGQLVVSNAPRVARGRFDAGRLVEGVRRRVDTAVADGFSGLRAASEMSLTLAPVDHLDQAVEYDRALHAALFAAPAGPAGPRCTVLCAWDARRFGGTSAMARAHAVHPVTVLAPSGALRVTATADGIAISGDSDVATRGEFDAALRVLSARAGRTLVLDLRDLSFLDGHSAGSVLALAAGLTAPRRLEVRCRGPHRRLLRLLGGPALRRLTIISEG